MTKYESNLATEATEREHSDAKRCRQAQHEDPLWPLCFASVFSVVSGFDIHVQSSLLWRPLRSWRFNSGIRVLTSRWLVVD